MRFRLVMHDTDDENKYDAESDKRCEYLGKKEDIWSLWYLLTQVLKKKHVEVFHINGIKQHPEFGMSGMGDYQL